MFPSNRLSTVTYSPINPFALPHADRFRDIARLVSAVVELPTVLGLPRLCRGQRAVTLWVPLPHARVRVLAAELELFLESQGNLVEALLDPNLQYEMNDDACLPTAWRNLALAAANLLRLVVVVARQAGDCRGKVTHRSFWLAWRADLIDRCDGLDRLLQLAAPHVDGLDY